MASSTIREVTSQAMLEEKKKLRKEFNYFDMIFYTLAALIGLDTLGAFAANGAQALTWVVIGGITFFLPYGLLTAELGSTFTQEGGMYEWCKMAGGRLFAALGAMLYWISNPLWIGGTLSVGAIAAIKTFWFGSSSYLFGGNNTTDAIVEIAIALAFIWGTTWCAIMSLRFGKWLSVFGSYIKLGLLVVFIVLAAFYLLSGHPGGSINGGALIPSDWGTIVSAILPVIIFQYVGFELQNGAGEEMEDPQRDVPRSIIRAGVIAAAAYILFVVVILLTVPANQLSNVGGFLAAIKAVVGVLPPLVALGLGYIIALAFVITLASSGGTWIIGADRTYAISALDRTAPVLLGRFSGRYGTPIAVNTMSGIVATVAMMSAVVISEFFSSGGIGTLFGLVLGFTISTTTLSYLFIFPAYLILRYKYPNARRPYKVPGGMLGAWIVTLLPLAYAVIASWFIVFPTDGAVKTAGVTRFTYELSQLIPLGIIVLLTVVFYIWGQSEKRNQDVVVELNTQTGAEFSAGAGGE